MLELEKSKATENECHNLFLNYSPGGVTRLPIGTRTGWLWLTGNPQKSLVQSGQIAPKLVAPIL